jgi:uncharacterized membrane protein YdbT with pleckstrin-like domain
MMEETAHDTFRPSTLGWLRGTLAGWGTILIALIGLGLTLAGYGIWWLGLVAASLLIILWKWLEAMASKYEVTDDRLIIRRGIIRKSIDEIELYRVKDVRIDFTIVNQLAGIGRISISSSDETTRGGDLVLACIERAQERREALRRLVDAARQRRQVREIDMVHEDIS